MSDLKDLPNGNSIDSTVKTTYIKISFLFHVMKGWREKYGEEKILVSLYCD